MEIKQIVKVSHDEILHLTSKDVSYFYEQLVIDGEPQTDKEIQKVKDSVVLHLIDSKIISTSIVPMEFKADFVPTSASYPFKESITANLEITFTTEHDLFKHKLKMD